MTKMKKGYSSNMDNYLSGLLKSRFPAKFDCFFHLLEGLAAGDVEGGFVVGVGDGEGRAGDVEGVERFEFAKVCGGVWLPGPGGEVAGAESGGGGPDPVFLGEIPLNLCRFRGK